MVPMGSFMAECDVAARRVVHNALELIRPAGVGEDALNRVIDLDAGLVLAYQHRQLGDQLIAALDHVLRNVVENLGAVVRGLLRPLAGCACGFHGVAADAPLRLPSGTSPTSLPSSA